MPKKLGYAVGLKRPPHVFFFDLDGTGFRKLKRYCSKYLKHFSIYKSKHGYHMIGYPFRRKIWRIFKRAFKTDYTLKLFPRWGNPRFSTKSMVLRISEKWDENGKVVSERPKLMTGNFLLFDPEKYMIIYRCKI